MLLWLHPSGIIPSSARKPSSDPYENLQVDSICFNGSKPEFVPELFLCPGTARWSKERTKARAVLWGAAGGREEGWGWAGGSCPCPEIIPEPSHKS